MAFKVRRHGCVADGPHERTGRRKPASEEDVCRRTAQGRDRCRGPHKKMVAPSQLREMAQWAVAQRSATIGLACQAFGISQTCYRYRAKLDAENDAVADTPSASRCMRRLLSLLITFSVSFRQQFSSQEKPSREPQACYYDGNDQRQR